MIRTGDSIGIWTIGSWAAKMTEKTMPENTCLVHGLEFMSRRPACHLLGILPRQGRNSAPADLRIDGQLAESYGHSRIREVGGCGSTASIHPLPEGGSNARMAMTAKVGSILRINTTVCSTRRRKSNIVRTVAVL